MTTDITTPRPVRAALYERISVLDPTSCSIDEQDAHGEATISREGWELVGKFVDSGISAFSGAERQDWQRLMNEIEAGRIDVLVVWEPSRATRDRAVWAALAASCEENSVRINASGKTYDPSDPDEAFMLDLFFALARRESAVTRKRVRRTMETRAERGHPPGGPCLYGYRRTRDRDGAVTGLAFDDELRTMGADGSPIEPYSPAGIVREIFARAVFAEPVYAIVCDLNRRRIPNPRTLHALERHPHKQRKYSPRWTTGAVKMSCIRNDAYIGRRRHGGKLKAEECWPALITPELYHTLQSMMLGRKRAIPNARPTRIKYLLSRLAVCDHCGARVQVKTTRDDDSDEPRLAYRCATGGVHVPMHEADQFVEAAILGWLSEPDNLSALNSGADVADEIARARALAAEKRSELDQWSAAAQRGDVELGEFIGRRAALLPEIELLERSARTGALPLELRALLGDPGEDFRGAWDSLKLPAKRAVISTLATVVLVPIPIRERPKPPPIERRIRIEFRVPQ